MQLEKSTIHLTLKQAAVVTTAAFLAIIFATVSSLGCGESSSTPTTKSVPLASGLSRPSAGVVEVIDALGDTTDPTGKVIQAPREVDISRASISKEGQNLKFTMEVSGPLPSKKPADTSAAQWGFLLDTDGDGQPDWGVYAGLPVNKENWSWGLFNQKTKEDLADQQFPGTFSHSGTTLVLTINPSSFGDPQSFKWVAYTDDAAKLTSDVPQERRKGRDQVPEKSWPHGDQWLDYP